MISAVAPTGFTVVNTGNGPAGAFSVTFDDGTNFAFSALAPGATATESFTCSTVVRTATISPASYAGAGGATFTVPVCPPTPSLTASAVGPSGFTIQNAGTGPAGAFTVTLSDGTNFTVSGLDPGASASESFACSPTARTASINPASYAGAGGATFPIPACPPRVSASLTLTCPGGGPLGVSYAFSGSLTPTLAGSTVTITYTPLRGSSVTDTVTTDSAGAYKDSFTPRSSSTWTAQAQFSGDATRLPASSPSCTLPVG
jgi:hypothetical protein